ncbi:hypothetical protein GJ496_005029 [Pomphorhynchus laevis]|nr:hypothetical protein GJ496_005029 [Pomphorhynchus laevis]
MLCSLDSSKLVYDIILKEKSRIIGKTLLSVNENQPEASFSLTFPNLLGSGEVFNLSFAKGLSKASNFSAAFSTFPAWDIAKKLTYMVTQNNRLILRSGNLNHMYRSAQLEYRQSLLNWKYLSKIILTAQLDSSDISTSDKYLPLQQYRECGVFSGASLSVESFI